MRKNSTWKRVAAVICLMLLITGCGQKGDLYLPQGSNLISWIG